MSNIPIDKYVEWSIDFGFEIRFPRGLIGLLKEEEDEDVKIGMSINSKGEGENNTTLISGGDYRHGKKSQQLLEKMRKMQLWKKIARRNYLVGVRLARKLSTLMTWNWLDCKEMPNFIAKKHFLETLLEDTSVLNLALEEVIMDSFDRILAADKWYLLEMDCEDFTAVEYKKRSFLRGYNLMLIMGDFAVKTSIDNRG